MLHVVLSARASQPRAHISIDQAVCARRQLVLTALTWQTQPRWKRPTVLVFVNCYTTLRKLDIPVEVCFNTLFCLNDQFDVNYVVTYLYKNTKCMTRICISHYNIIWSV